MVEVGMCGAILYKPWKDREVLATKHTWYYNLWEPCNRLGVKLKVGDMYNIKPVRQEDCSIVDMTLEMGHREKILESMNIV